MPDKPDKTEGAPPRMNARSRGASTCVQPRQQDIKISPRDLAGSTSPSTADVLPGHSAAAAFAQLAGEWALRRIIPGVGGMVGRAVFTPLRPGVLHYREDGRLELASGHAGEAYREYYYLLERDHIHVTFADAPPGERTFLRLRPRPVAGCAGSWAHDTHYCGRDVYTGTYNFESAGRLVVTIAVHGPEKDYVIRTALTREAAGPVLPDSW